MDEKVERFMDGVKVLDHGYVKLIEWMGSDETIVEAARMSTGRGFVRWEAYQRCKRCDAIAFGVCGPVSDSCDHDWQIFPRGDFGLLETLYKNGHSTPFEMCEVAIEVQAPIMVFREWHRHRTQAYSEFSARYAQMPDLHYVPERSRIQKQSTTNKQGSGEGVSDPTAERIQRMLATQQDAIYQSYDGMIAEGIAKETARINTPVSRYSKMRAKTDLRNWLGFLNLRLRESAQWEIRQYAQVVSDVLETLYPKTMALFEEWDLCAVKFSDTERQTLARLLHGSTDPEAKALLLKLHKDP